MPPTRTPPRWSPLAPHASVVGGLILLLAPTISSAQSLTAEEALAAALAANPSFRAALADAVAARAAARAAENQRHPTFVAGVDGQYQERFSSTVEGVTRNADERIGASVGLQYTTEIGTAVELAIDTSMQWLNVNRDVSTTDRYRVPVTNSAQATLTARQPLLRGAGSDAVLSDIRQAKMGARQARHERDAAASQLVLEVLSAYWELWYAERSLAVQREALAVAERQAEEARLRAEVLGTGARTDTLRFGSELASLRESVTAAESTRRSRAITLGGLLGIGPEQAAGLVPSASDPVAAGAPAADTLVANAKRTSPELLSLGLQLEVARERVVAAEDASQNRLDVVGSTGVAGLWTRDPLPGLALPGDRPAFFAMLGVDLELPLGQSVGQANLERTVAQRQATEERYEARVQSIEAEIATLRHELDASRERVELSTETARIAGDLAEAERNRLELGTTTPSYVVEAQQTARESEVRRLRALVDAVTTGLRLDHASGRLLDRFSIPVPTEVSSS